MATTIANKNNKPLESSIGNSSLGKKEVEETVLQNVEGSDPIVNEEEDEISAIRRRIETLSVQIADVENICRTKSGSGWRIVCSSRAVCDKLRQFNIVLEEIADEKRFIRIRLQELKEEMKATQSALKYCEERPNGDVKRGLERSHTSRHSIEREVISSGAAAAAPERKENMDQDTITEPVQQNEMERLNNVPSRTTATGVANDYHVQTMHRRLPSIMKHHDEEERKKLEKELIRAEKEMKYDYYFMKEVAESELKTALQRLSDLKYQASETEVSFESPLLLHHQSRHLYDL